MNGVRPIQVYIQNDILYANVKLYSGDNTTPIEIDGRTFVVQPEGWEYNYDALAFEVVDDEKQPVFQFIRRTAFDVVVNGVLSVRGWVVAGNESGLIINPSPLQLAEFSLNPIFKYPSSKYQGQRRQVK